MRKQEKENWVTGSKCEDIRRKKSFVYTCV